MSSQAAPPSSAARPAASPAAEATTQPAANGSDRRSEHRQVGHHPSARKRLGSLWLDAGLNGLARVGKLHPFARRMRDGVEVTRDIPYTDSGSPAHLLDVYRPSGATGPLPVMLYVHGGGFRILSKDSHWMFGYGFAQRGFVVFNINYRLAPVHPYPCGLEDAAAALQWVLDHAADYGGDVSRLVYAGDSAGCNLVTSLAVAGSYERPEPFAQRLFARDPRPTAVLAACGMLQVSNARRYLSQEELPGWVRKRIKIVCNSYLPDDSGDPDRFGLADPLLILESGRPAARALPTLHVTCGTADPIRDDSRRLIAALDALGGGHRGGWYDGGGHAFHAFIWTRLARAWWDDAAAFLDEHVDS